MKRLFGVAVLMAAVLAAAANEHGRESLPTAGTGAGLGRASLPAASSDNWWGGGVWGVKAGLGWALVDWDLGPASGSEGVFAPQITVFYKATDNLDVNLSAAFFSAQDEDAQLGDTEADMTRLALGIRYWFNTGTRITPYVGGGLGYYLLDGTTDNTRENGAVVAATSISMDDMPGAFLEGGVAFQVSDNVFINTEITYDFLLGSADAEINGDNEDFDISALAIGLGVTWMF